MHDLIIHSKTLVGHISALERVFQKLRCAGSKLNPKKCDFIEGPIEYPGHVVSRDGIHTFQEK